MYLPQLDAMRFFAFLAVFFLHILPGVEVAAHHGASRTFAIVASAVQDSGEYGVGLFFLLSSYLITKLLLLEKQTTGDIHLKQFYLRRLLRIWPLYYLIVLIGLAVQPLNSQYHLTSPRILSYLFFYVNWVTAFMGWAWNPIFPLWTVSCEEQFYAFWPLMMKFLSERAAKILCFFLIGFIVVAALTPAVFVQGIKARHFISDFIYFPLGMLLASRDPIAPEPWRNGVVALSVLAGALLWVASTLLMITMGGGGVILSYALGLACQVAGTVVLFYAFRRSAAGLWPKGIVYLGKISYGLYVFHVLVIDLLAHPFDVVGLGVRTGAGHTLANILIYMGFRVPLCLAVTIGVSMLSYRYYESYFLRLKHRFEFVHTRSV